MYQMIHFLGADMSKTENYCDFFGRVFLFNGVHEDRIAEILSMLDISVCEFKKGDIIYSQDHFNSDIGFVIDGECVVCRKRNNGTPLPLNVLHRYDSFGVTAVFSDKDTFPTDIYAKKATKVVFISKKTLLNAIKAYADIAMNVIVFLTNRIEFLNKKIATLSSCGCDEKLSRLLLSEDKKHNGEPFLLNCKAAAEGLGIGRASLYRGIKSLSDSGYIEYVDKKIYIKDPDGLKGISK